MDSVSSHLNEITSYSKVNQERLIKNLSLRHAPIVVPEEHCTFPVAMLPRKRNEEFYGRTEELARINEYLDYRVVDNLRTYTIYGRWVLPLVWLILTSGIVAVFAVFNPSSF
jgi:hypothetical protein